MTDIFHMHPYLVRTPGFQTTFYKRNISQTLESRIMSYGMLTIIALGRHGHLQTIFQTTTYISFDPTFVLLHSSPYECNILPFCRFIKKLQSQIRFRFGSFSDHQQTRSIFIEKYDAPILNEDRRHRIKDHF